jgi:hypothetical protein
MKQPYSALMERHRIKIDAQETHDSLSIFGAASFELAVTCRAKCRRIMFAVDTDQALTIQELAGMLGDAKMLAEKARRGG